MNQLWAAFLLTGWLSGPADVWAAVTITFRDGVSPSPAYSGTSDVVVYSQDGLCWDATAACDTESLIADSSPADSAVLMRWDLGSIPTNATVNSASLTFYIEASSSYPYPIYEALRPWVEGQANWTLYATGSSWQSPGGQGAADHGSAVLGTLMGSVANSFLTVPLTAAGIAVVQQWVSTPATNRGIHIIDFGSPDALIWASSETSIPARRPRLTVTYNGSTVANFQQGAQPNAGYLGATDQSYGTGPNPYTYNYNVSTSLDLSGAGSREAVLLKFDLSLIPAWATVNAAALSVTTRSNGGNSGVTFPAYEALQPWVETEVTWARYDATHSWAALGADSTVDHGSSVILTATSPVIGPQTWPFTSAGVQLVNDWVSGAKRNNGILFLDYVQNAYLGFSRRENATPEQRPGLVLTYTEGRLVLSPANGATSFATASTPLTVSRETLGGTSIVSGAPALTVTVTSSSGTTEFAPNSGGPWSASYSTVIGAGLSESDSFVFRDSTVGALALTASADAAWDVGLSDWTLLSSTEPPAAPESQHLHVTSGCSASRTHLLPFLTVLWILSRARTRHRSS